MSLVSVAELAERLDDPDLVVVDVRFHLADHDRGRRDYAVSHVPGAVFVDVHHDLAGGPGGGRHPLPAVADFAALLGRLGISLDTVVVAYDDAGGATAARLWWMLRSIGHERAAVLDGGFPAWVADGRPVTDEIPQRPAVDHPSPHGWAGTVDADDVAAALGTTTVVDSRAGERYRGETEPLDPRAGHIPGAVHRFHGENLGEDGRHRPVEELAARFAELGPDPIVYCGSGVTACHNLLAMSLAGVEDARLYPGSWSEWSSDPERPIATGG